jgi:DNA-binding XRE family transcriptional regulator
VNFDFGKLVKRYRLNHNPPFTLEELGDKVGVSKTAIRNIESGTMPKFPLALNIIDHLGIPPQLIFRIRELENNADSLLSISQHCEEGDENCDKVLVSSSGILLRTLTCRKPAKISLEPRNGFFVLIVYDGKVMLDFGKFWKHLMAGQMAQFPGYLRCKIEPQGDDIARFIILGHN